MNCMNARTVIQIVIDALKRDEEQCGYRFKFDPHDIHVIKLFGSRAYGCARDDSDYDFIVVCRHFHVDHYYRSIEGMKHAVKHEKDYMFETDYSCQLVCEDDNDNNSARTESGKAINVGVHILNSDYYMEMVREHEATMLLSMFLDGENQVWLEDERMRHYRTQVLPRYGLMLRKVQRGFARVADIAYSKSCRIWSADAYKSAKNMAHAYRYLAYGRQIVEHGRIVDFTAPNDVCAQVISCHETCTEWQQMKELYYASYYAMREALKSHTKKAVDQMQSRPYNSVVALLNDNDGDISILNKYYSVHVVPFNGHNSDHDFYLMRDRKMASRTNVISRACNMCVVARDGASNQRGVYSLLGSSVTVPDTKSVEESFDDMDSYRCYLKPKGTTYSMFYHREEKRWTACSETYGDEYLRRLCVTSGDDIARQFESEHRFWSVWKQLGYGLPREDELNMTFSFILTASGNSIVLQWTKRTDEPEEEDFVPLASKYHWSHLVPIELNTNEPLRSFVNDPNRVDPLTYTGVLLIKWGTAPHRIEVKSTLYNSFDKLNVWDVSLVRSSDDSIPFQGIDSEANNYALLDILRLYNELDTENRMDERAIEVNCPLFLQSYRDMKHAVLRAFQWIDHQFSTIWQECCEQSGQRCDRARFARRVDSVMNKGEAKRIRTCLFSMWSLVVNNNANKDDKSAAMDPATLRFQDHVRFSIDPRLMYHIWQLGVKVLSGRQTD